MPHRLGAAGHSPNVENPELLLDTLVPTWRTWLRYDYREQPMAA